MILHIRFFVHKKGGNLMSKKRGAGEGSITQRKDGMWQGAVTVGRNKNGTQKRKYFYGKTRAEVSKKITTALKDLQEGNFIDPSGETTLKQWLTHWLWIYKKNDLKPTTFEQYEVLLRKYLYQELGKVKLTELTTDKLQTLYNCMKDRGLSAKTIRTLNVVVHAGLKQAIWNGLIHKNITEQITLPKEEYKEMRVLSKDEQRKLIDVIKEDRMGTAILFSLMTGVRRGELLSLKWSDIDMDKRMVFVRRTVNRVKNYGDGAKKTKLVISDTKTAKSRRMIPIVDSLFEFLQKHKAAQDKEKILAGELYEDNDLVFATEIGKLIDPGNFNRTFSRMIKKAGIAHANLHSLRHTFATRSLEAGVNIKVLQELMGHSSMSVTADVYSHVMTEVKIEEMKKLGDIFDGDLKNE